ncbi:uncharacterized protein [Littorina saxatilis]|uniref:SWIM-type domain-containing protein n=1 Tax=Littorina saxatilis TaxID=31220 RepID=A0AAN9AU32_9CAEN
MDRNRDFRAWKVPELKTFLKDRGINVSGRKEELIARAKGCEALDISVNIHDDDSENSGLMLRQYELLTTPNGYKLPDPTKLDGWKDVLECPDVTDRHITEYLVHSRHRTEDKRQMGATRQLKASSLFKEGHVFSPNYHPIAEDCSHCFVSARVMPSLPGRDQRTTPHHFTWICLSKSDGVVHSADCSCTAGEGGSCNHIAAVLYMLADLTERRQQGLLSCTSQTAEPQSQEGDRETSAAISAKEHRICSRKSSHELFKAQGQAGEMCSRVWVRLGDSRPRRAARGSPVWFATAIVSLLRLGRLEVQTM